MNNKSDKPIPNITLSINPETVCYIIAKARELHAKEGVTFPENKIPGSQDEYDWLQILADHKSDLTFQEINKIIYDLEPDQKVDLLTLLYVGRGDYDVRDWSSAHKEARSNLSANFTHYLLTKPLLSDYLAEALNQLGYSCEE